MAKTKEIEEIDSLITSLAKMILGMNEGHELTHEQLELFKKAYHAESTWNPLKQKDLVPVSEIFSVEEEQEEGSGTKLTGFERQFSTTERVIYGELDTKLRRVADALIEQAEKGVMPENLMVEGNSPWQKMLRELLKKTMKMVEEEKRAR